MEAEPKCVEHHVVKLWHTRAISLGDLFLVLNVMGRRAEDLEIERGDMVDRWK